MFYTLVASVGLFVTWVNVFYFNNFYGQKIWYTNQSTIYTCSNDNAIKQFNKILFCKRCKKSN